MPRISLAEVMTKFPLTVQTEDPLTEVQDIFDQNSIHHIPVLSEEKQIVGIISKTDLDQLSWGMSLFKNPKRESYNEALMHTRRVKDVMTDNVYTLDVDDCIDDAYSVFRSEGFRAIPVLENGELVGIVTPIDLVKPFITN
jgi:acetoin utilization protein AcuB